MQSIHTSLPLSAPQLALDPESLLAQALLKAAALYLLQVLLHLREIGTALLQLLLNDESRHQRLLLALCTLQLVLLCVRQLSTELARFLPSPWLC